jgi:uncharacterized protein YcbX
MKKVGEISEIWRYPVKGMAGESLQLGQLGAQGLEGDRIWAVRDNARREIQSCKFRPELLLCSARVDAISRGAVEVIFPDGSVLGASDTRSHARVSEMIGHASTIEALRPAADVDFYRRHKADGHTWMTELRASFEREANEPLPGILDNFPSAAAEFVVMPGSFFLVTPFHLLTTASLVWMKTINPDADWQSRRFRPNVVVDTGSSHGPIEQDWIGQRITVGDAAVACVDTTPRCGAVTRAQADLPMDKTTLRTVVKHGDQNLGIYGKTVSGGEIRVGDAVYLAGLA